jgi:hypothetical protein
MIDLSGGLVCIQQKTSGSGVFDGSLTLGFATRAWTPGGGGAGAFRAREMGTEGNGWAIQCLDPGVNLASCQVDVNWTSKIVTVLLKKTAGSISATLSDVQAALAGYQFNSAFTPGVDRTTRVATGALRSPILLGITTDGTAAALASGLLTGGQDPVVDGSIYRFTAANNANAGMFYFANREPIIVYQVEGSVAATALKIANVDDGLIVRSGETSDLSAQLSGGALVYTPLILAPRQVLLVSAPTGTLRVWAQRASRWQL